MTDVVFAELSIGFDAVESCDAFLAGLQIEVVRTPRAALFAAGQAFRADRSRGGPRASVLPDFFIGAHAAHVGMPLITRDPRRYRTAFPGLRLIARNAAT